MAGARALVFCYPLAARLCGTHPDLHGDGRHRQCSVGRGGSGAVSAVVFVGIGYLLGVERFRPRTGTHHRTHVLAHPRVRWLPPQSGGHDARAR